MSYLLQQIHSIRQGEKHVNTLYNNLKIYMKFTRFKTCKYTLKRSQNLYDEVYITLPQSLRSSMPNQFSKLHKIFIASDASKQCFAKVSSFLIDFSYQ